MAMKKNKGARTGIPVEAYKKREADKTAPLILHDEDIERYLVTGENAGLLEDYFGPDEYREMRQLALKATRRRTRGPRVLILPGIMGSRLGAKRSFPLPDEEIWFDPLDIAAGRISDLALDSGKSCVALGVMLPFYLKLKLRLEIAGYDADFFSYDWRQGIDQTGAVLAARLREEKSEKVHLVAHSMGGLVARAAFGRIPRKVGRIVMLGTPNFGSFVPVQCLRGVYSTVRKLAFLDAGHSAEEIAGKVLGTFPGLYHMLPSQEKFSTVNLFDPGVWPKEGPQPSRTILKDTPDVQAALAPGREGFYLIAGVDRETVTGLILDEKDFLYELSRQGDGTVPLALAELPGAKTYYIRESHASLQNNRLAAQAVADILATGRTTVLSDRWTPTSGAPRTVSDGQLRGIPVNCDLQGRKPGPRETRLVLKEFLSTETDEKEWAPGVDGGEGLQKGAAEPLFQGIVVGRRRQHRIEIRLAFGDIREVDAEALVLGIFKNVAPTGPARALDDRLGGAISEFTARRMFSGNMGEVFMIPTGRHNLRADTILFIGLGAFDDYSGEVQQIAAENVVRTLVQSRIDEFATLLFGAGSGEDVPDALYNLLAGLIRGLKDADRDRRMRRIVLCELDRGRFDAMKRELLQLAGTPLFEDVEVTFDEVILPAAPETIAPVTRSRGGADPVYLIVRREGDHGGSYGFRSSILGAGDKAAILTGVKEAARAELDGLLKRIGSQSFTLKGMEDFGQRLGKAVLAPEVRVVLAAMRERHIVVVHDTDSSRIPWETIAVDGWFPAKEAGLSRQYLAENLSVAKWLEERRKDEALNILLVVDPTDDLDAAREEGERIKAVFSNHPAVRIDELRGNEASKGALLRMFRSGIYDVIHYAGHAFFAPGNPAESGIICSGKQVLSGRDLAGIGQLPSMVFFNACEAARVRKGSGLGRKMPEMTRSIERNVGFAEAFLRGGIANYIGTYWSVGDVPARMFAETFYTHLMKGETVGNALQAARRAIAGKYVDWADYIHYGDFSFRLKAR